MIRFGEFALDPQASQLLRAGIPVELQPKTYELLRLLLRAPGKLCSREEIEREIWPDVTVTEDSLTQAVRRLRTALGDDSRAPRFIETVPKRGYRFVGSVVSEGAVSEVPRRARPGPEGRLFGRRLEVEEVRAALRESRLVTVTGPGGVGKTRLAAELPEVVFRCDLGDALDETAILLAVCRGLGRPGSAEHKIVISALRGCAGVVWLDEAEPAREITARLAAGWLEEIPQLRLLVTSRARLSLTAERCVELGPLSPEEGAELYLDRARQVEPSAEDDSDTVASLVDALGGFPLAIEIAAARRPILSPGALLVRLSSLSVLVKAHPDRRERHRSMEEALSVSWSLLELPERVAAARLSLFVGGIPLEGAERLLADLGEPLERLEALREQSWLARDGERLLQYAPLRLFAEAKLDELGERQRATERFVWAMADLAERLSSEGTAALAAERANLWAAFRATRRPDLALRIAQRLVRIDVYARGAWDHLFDALDRVYDLAEGDPLTQSAAIEQRARLALRDDPAGSLRLARQALQLAGDDPKARANALRTFSMALPDGDSGILPALEEAVALACAASDPVTEAGALGNLGLALVQFGRITEAIESLLRAVQIWRRLEMPWQEAQALFWLCGPAAKALDLGLLRRCALRALEIFHPRHDASLYAECLRYLALLARIEGRLDDAEALLLQMEEQGRLSWLVIPALPLRLRAEIAIERDRLDEAAALLARLPPDPFPSDLMRAEAEFTEMLLFAAQGRLAEALERATRRAEVFRKRSHRSQEAASQSWRALLAASLGDLEETWRAADTALGLLDESMGPAARSFARLVEIAVPLAKTVQGDGDGRPTLKRAISAVEAEAPIGPTTGRPALTPEIRALVRLVRTAARM